MKIGRYHRVLSAFLVTVIILTTILAFPTTGLSLKANMTASKVSYSLGEIATFTPEIVLGLDEVKHMKSVTLVIDGPQPQSHSLPAMPGTYTNIPGLDEVVVEWKNIGGFPDPGVGYGYKGLAAPSSIKYTIKKRLPIYLDPRPKGHPEDLPVVTKLFDHQPLTGTSYFSNGVTVDPGTDNEWIVRDAISDSFFDIFVEVDPANPATIIKTVKLPSADISDATWLGTNPWVMDNAETWSDPVQNTDHFSSFAAASWSLQLTSVTPLRPAGVLYDVNGNGVAGCEDIALTRNDQAWGACLSFDAGSGQVALSEAAQPGDHVTATYKYSDLVLLAGARKLDVSVASGAAANVLKSAAVPPDEMGRRQVIGGLAIGGGNIFFASAETPRIFIAAESTGLPVGVVDPWGNTSNAPPPAWEALVYYNNALYGASGNTVYKIDLAANKEITGRWETIIPNITGLAVHNDELFLEGSFFTEQAGAEYTAGIPGAPPVHDTAEGDYSAKLRVVYAEDNNDQVDSNIVNFTVNKLSTVTITLEKPTDNQVFGTKTIDVKGKTSPGITQVTISRPLKDEPLDQSDFESGAGQWTKAPATSNLWNLTTEKSKSATHSWWYGKKDGDDLNYEVLDQFGSQVDNFGVLVSPWLNISGPASLSWWMYWNTKPGLWADLKLILVKHGSTVDSVAIVDDFDPTKTGAPLQPGDACTSYSLAELQTKLANLSDPAHDNIQMAVDALKSFDPDMQNLIVATQNDWTKCSLKLDAYAGQAIQLGFLFDTVTDWDNIYDGWFIDDILVVGEAPYQNPVNVAADSSFATTFDIEEGLNVITVSAKAPYAGPSGPITGQTSVTVFLDTLAPVCVLDPLPLYTNNAVQRVKGKCSDMNPSTLAVKVNGAPVFTKATGLIGGDSFFDIFVNLAEGENVIEASLVDKANLTGKVTVTTTLDTTGPVISALTPSYPVGQVSARPGSSTRPGDPVMFQLNVSDVGSTVDRVWMIVPGPGGPQEVDFLKSADIPQAVIAQWGTTGNYILPYQLPGGLPSGTYSLTVKARDKGGNISPSTVSANIVATLEAFNIYFMPGANLFSTPLIPNDTNLVNLMSEGLGVTGSNNAEKEEAMRAKGLQTVWYYNAAESDPNKSWMKWDTDPNSPDNLAVIEPGKGYWATWDGTKFSYSAPLGPGQPQTPAPVKMTIEGTFLTPGNATMPTYDVYQGWNLVGMHSENPLPAGTYFASLIGKQSGQPIWGSLYQYLNLIKSNNEATLGAFERLISSDTMVPGLGYWLYMVDNGTIAP